MMQQRLVLLLLPRKAPTVPSTTLGRQRTNCMQLPEIRAFQYQFNVPI